MSHIKRRIEALELDTGVVRGELPVDLRLDSVSGRLPGGDFGADGLPADWRRSTQEEFWRYITLTSVRPIWSDTRSIW